MGKSKKEPCRNELDYFYGGEHEKYKFYRIPAVLIRDERFAWLPLNAVMLYGLLLDRTDLSIRNGWRDPQGRVYIKFRQAEAMELLRVGKNSIIKMYNALTEAGLIERVRIGFGESDMIYVKNFATLAEQEAQAMKAAVGDLPFPADSGDPGAGSSGAGGLVQDGLVQDGLEQDPGDGEALGDRGDTGSQSQRFTFQTTVGLESKPQRFTKGDPGGLENTPPESTKTNLYYNNQTYQSQSETARHDIQSYPSIKTADGMDRWKKLLGVDDVLRSERPRLFKVIAAEVFDVICGLLEKEEYQESIIRLGEIGFEKLVKLCARYGDETEDLRGFILQKLEECSGGERAQSGSMDPGAVRMRIRENLEYDWFVEMYRTAPRSERPAGSVEQLDSIVEIIVEVLCSDQKMIRVSGAQMPRELVCQRLMSLNSEHIIYVMDCLEKNPSEIRNIKAYLLTVLYNAPATMDSYYSALLRSNRGKSRE